MSNGTKNRAKIEAVLGGTGTGKSSYVKRRIEEQKPKRLMIWDLLGEYDGYGQKFTKAEDLVKVVAQAGKAGKFAVIFQPSHDPKTRDKQFSLFCRLALMAGNCKVIVEELKFVTKPAHAPLAWSQLTLTGRHQGIDLTGTSQRPASIDKDFLGNCTHIHTGRLTYPNDVKAVLDAMNLSGHSIQDLPDLHFIEKNMQTGAVTKNSLKF